MLSIILSSSQKASGCLEWMLFSGSESMNWTTWCINQCWWKHHWWSHWLYVGPCLLCYNARCVSPWCQNSEFINVAQLLPTSHPNWGEGHPSPDPNPLGTCSGSFLGAFGFPHSSPPTVKTSICKTAPWIDRLDQLTDVHWRYIREICHQTSLLQIQNGLASLYKYCIVFHYRPTCVTPNID